jgi:hypothetical protein
MIDMKRLEQALEAGYEDESQSMRFAGAYGRATVYMKMFLEEMPQDRQEYWMDRIQYMAEQRRKEMMDLQAAAQ